MDVDSNIYPIHLGVRLRTKGRNKMIQKIIDLLKKYEEIIAYLIVGVLNTIVSWLACWICEITLLNPSISWQNTVINLVGWIAGVLFGFWANRKYVFKSKNPKVIREFINFSGSRVSTLVLDIVIMYVTVNVIHMHYWIAKVFISSVLVMIANYVFSKLFVFKKENK